MDGMTIAVESVAPASNVCRRENKISVQLSGILETFGVGIDFQLWNALALLVVKTWQACELRRCSRPEIPPWRMNDRLT